MLVSNVYAIRDVKAECFMFPLFADTDTVAALVFLDAIRDPNTAIGKDPEFYTLYRVGVWNTESGVLAGTDIPIPVMTGVQAMAIKA